jgi:hypothetical protein
LGVGLSRPSSGKLAEAFTPKLKPPTPKGLCRKDASMNCGGGPAGSNAQDVGTNVTIPRKPKALTTGDFILNAAKLYRLWTIRQGPFFKVIPAGKRLSRIGRFSNPPAPG